MFTRRAMALMSLMYVVTASFAYAQFGSAQNLFDYFSAHCRSQGDWTRGALADSKALIDTLQGIADDPNCRSVAGAVSQLNLLYQSLERLQSMDQLQSRIAELDHQEQELLILLTTSDDFHVIDGIHAELRALQVERATILGSRHHLARITAPHKAEIMLGTIQIANAAFSQIVENQQCIQNNSAILNRATSIMSAVGAVANSVNPALGFGLSAGSNFLGHTVENLRRGKINRDIRRLANSTIAFEGFKCALEAMSDRWCVMQDAESFLRFRASERFSSPIEPTLRSAIQVNDRDIPIFLDWLNQVRSGTLPQTSADANRQAAVLSMQSTLETNERRVIGLIEENRNIFNGIDDPRERWNLLRMVLLSIADPDTLYHEMHHPLFRVVPVSYAPYYMLGIAEDDPRIRDRDGNLRRFNEWVPPAGFNPTLDVILSNFEEWVRIARNQINREMAEVLQVDPSQVLAMAFDETRRTQGLGSQKGVSPIQAIQNLISFLSNTSPIDSNPVLGRLYESTVAEISRIHGLLVTYKLDPDVDPISLIQGVYEIAKLQYGVVLFQNRFEMFVRYSLLNYFQNAPSEDQSVVAQILASDRFADAIRQTTRSDSTAAALREIGDAKRVVIQNLDALVEVFHPNINHMLGELRRIEFRNTGDVARVNRGARASMCYLLLASNRVGEFIDPSLCEGLQLIPKVPGGPVSEPISSQTFNLQFEDRACQYRDYFRRNRIFERWGI